MRQTFLGMRQREESHLIMSEEGVLGLLLMAILGFAAFSRRLEMSVVTMPLVFTAAGYLAHLAGAELVQAEAQLEVLKILAEVTLVLILFSDASQVRLSQLRKNAGIPLRMLLIGMPLSIALGTLAAFWVSPDQPWTLALLVAAILTPTDAALGQAVVSDEAVPVHLRESIAVESGLNDGLTLPVVIIAALAVVEASGGMQGETAGSLTQFGLAQITLGPLAGIIVGGAAAKLRDFAVGRDLATKAYQGIFFLAAAFLCFVAAELIGGNGLIAAFVGGLTFGNLRNGKSAFVAEFMESEGQLLTMATFAIFGVVLVPAGLAHATWQTLALAILFLTFVRILPIMLALTGTGLAWREKLFLGWFGPRGLASILFALLVAETYQIPGLDELIACVVLTVMLSILVHGASAFPIVRAFAATKSRGPAS
jgi:NhaP-type Na+/H+ or K+/H+ antiporter